MPVQTPYYTYDSTLFSRTIEAAKSEAACLPQAKIHLAVKSNSNARLIAIAAKAGLGADCVSGAEIAHCINCQMPAHRIMFAGVGKTDEEINLALDAGIGCFNVESVPELDVIQQLAVARHTIANVAFRINPDVDAHTHANITTGLEANKFGISMADMIDVIRRAQSMSNIHYLGLHFHIGSQVLDMTCFRQLSLRINQLQDQLEQAGITGTTSINVGGGLGIDYEHPELNPIPNFRDYFRAYADNLELRPGQSLHFELGRALTAQCGRLITRCVFVKQTATKQFAIVDAGFTALIRPALYQAFHKIVNLTGQAEQRPLRTYDVVGPICESSDVFATDIELHEVRRGDTLAILSAGAYGFVMSSTYNLRALPQEVVE
ncbi:MAG: diaminopimelate decarboxylase [Bacteroidaceae bacterium]|nr:diaminopimelate decarboxylase [Bacteroidaceae bacterium]